MLSAPSKTTGKKNRFNESLILNFNSGFVNVLYIVVGFFFFFSQIIYIGYAVITAVDAKRARYNVVYAYWM